MNLLDLIFPRDLYCLSCGRPVPLRGKEGFALCESCAGEIQWIKGRVCEKCGRLLSPENPGKLCHDCGDAAEHIFGKAYACVLYGGRVSGIVRDMKYHSRPWYADTLSALMAARYFAAVDPETGELPCFDYILPVPMSVMKRAVRGYDQAALLAKGLSRRIGAPCLEGALRRMRDTNVMSGLSSGERRQNLEGAFLLSCDMIDIVVGKRLLLVDDVYTTGSTVDTCAGVLLGAGAASVDVFVFAIGADVRRLATARTEDRPAVAESRPAESRPLSRRG